MPQTAWLFGWSHLCRPFTAAVRACPLLVNCGGGGLLRTMVAAAMSPEFNARTIEQVADALLVSERTVRRWIASGELSAFTAGGVKRILDADLRLFLRQHGSLPDDGTLPGNVHPIREDEP